MQFSISANFLKRFNISLKIVKLRTWLDKVVKCSHSNKVYNFIYTRCRCDSFDVSFIKIYIMKYLLPLLKSSFKRSLPWLRGGEWRGNRTAINWSFLSTERSLAIRLDFTPPHHKSMGHRAPCQHPCISYTCSLISTWLIKTHPLAIVPEPGDTAPIIISIIN